MNRRWILQQRPQGRIDPRVLALSSERTPACGDEQILVRNVYLSLDPSNRMWMSTEPQYLPPVALGDVMRGVTIGRVIESRHSKFAVGDWVTGLGQWQDYWLTEPKQVGRLRPIANVPLTIFFGLLGPTGFAAYFGMSEVSQPRAGETVVISGAAGAVGSIAGQVAKLLAPTAYVVGIAGTDEKCAWITKNCGFDCGINYRSEDVRARLKEIAPDGVDVYFDNVGGRVTEAVFDNLRIGARIALCGLISSYNDQQGTAGPGNYSMLLMRRATLRGFLVMDYAARFKEASEQLLNWHGSGTLQYRIDIREGLEGAPSALEALFDGTNIGKLIIQISKE